MKKETNELQEKFEKLQKEMEIVRKTQEEQQQKRKLNSHPIKRKEWEKASEAEWRKQKKEYQT